MFKVHNIALVSENVTYDFFPGEPNGLLILGKAHDAEMMFAKHARLAAQKNISDCISNSEGLLQ